jgi:hypothetical protein
MPAFIEEGWRYDQRFLDRLLARCSESPDGCWVHPKPHPPTGYGRVRHRGASQMAHRVVFRLLRSDVPTGLQLDHLCRNRACCNPWHLEPVTPKVNTRRARSVQAKRTHCQAGHEYSAANTYVDSEGWRYCRACRARAARDFRGRSRG